VSPAEIKARRSGGDSPWEILAAAVQGGMEFPDASARIAQALRMEPDEVEQMERDYDECC
jgi:hypothetical protein